MTEPSKDHPLFGPVLADLSDEDRDHVLSAYAAVEYSAAPVPEVQLLALRDATLRRTLDQLLDRTGRALVRVDADAWTSGYRDDIAAELTAHGTYSLPVVDRAVLVLVLIHSVAIPRSQGVQSDDVWTSPHPTTRDELYRYTQLPRGETNVALQRLRAAGLVQQAPSRGRSSAGTTAYLPGPQLHRLTPAARKALQEELILAAAPASPLATMIRARRDQRAHAATTRPRKEHHGS